MITRRVRARRAGRQTVERPVAPARLPQSTLGLAADILLPLPLVKEACPHNLAPTSSSVVQTSVPSSTCWAFSSGTSRTPEPPPSPSRSCSVTVSPVPRRAAASSASGPSGTGRPSGSTTSSSSSTPTVRIPGFSRARRMPFRVGVLGWDGKVRRRAATAVAVATCCWG